MAEHVRAAARRRARAAGRSGAAREDDHRRRAHDAHAGALASDYQGPDGASLVAGAAVLVPRDGGDLRAKVRQAAAQGAAAVLRLRRRRDLPAGALGGDDASASRYSSIDGALGLRIAQAVAAGQEVTFTAGAATYAPTRCATPSRRSRRRASAGTTA